MPSNDEELIGVWCVFHRWCPPSNRATYPTRGSHEWPSWRKSANRRRASARRWAWSDQVEAFKQGQRMRMRLTRSLAVLNTVLDTSSVGVVLKDVHTSAHNIDLIARVFDIHIDKVYLLQSFIVIPLIYNIIIHPINHTIHSVFISTI